MDEALGCHGRVLLLGNGAQQRKVVADIIYVHKELALARLEQPGVELAEVAIAGAFEVVWTSIFCSCVLAVSLTDAAGQGPQYFP
eukprot:7331629-Lingulodinium_polyedra.AAC.1